MSPRSQVRRDTPDVRLYHDPVGDTLTIWFGDPETEFICEETGAEVIVMKNKTGTAIGVEVLNYRRIAAEDHPITVEVRTL